MRLRLVGLLALGLLASCGPPSGDPIVEIVTDDPTQQVELASDGTITAITEGGLVEREPDTCQLANYAELIGQSQTDASFFAFDRPFRFVGPDDIVTQEYDPRRVNLYVNGNGVVVRTNCG